MPSLLTTQVSIRVGAVARLLLAHDQVTQQAQSQCGKGESLRGVHVVEEEEVVGCFDIVTAINPALNPLVALLCDAV